MVPRHSSGQSLLLDSTSACCVAPSPCEGRRLHGLPVKPLIMQCFPRAICCRSVHTACFGVWVLRKYAFILLSKRNPQGQRHQYTSCTETPTAAAAVAIVVAAVLALILTITYDLGNLRTLRKQASYNSYTAISRGHLSADVRKRSFHLVG